jgi:hypothetical protein
VDRERLRVANVDGAVDRSPVGCRRMFTEGMVNLYTQ